MNCLNFKQVAGGGGGPNIKDSPVSDYKMWVLAISKSDGFNESFL